MAERKHRHGVQTPEQESSVEQIAAPCPGDTLPWNLSKHQRIKRSKSTSGEVLDPAERAVIRIAAEGHRTRSLSMPLRDFYMYC
ncbi:Microtubule-actin cross-linking factor 1, isoforms 1/2/3/5 620 kDa actin-binding protein [Takifugu flavidus]|uniref:Microtubule-actin cross-linking factor 1, isoforms 1/2/3/5 620 kDa actin-binding protein n=1 Tax=Takifugu flavidus TaxID=433684 RepID=A0A5C6PL03_9TELE|nr:Microtubule-actin cross-linking factor 1, isoforms 1/2/3/5 620 kDa actin-binding protein [Takifugu flavidus]